MSTFLEKYSGCRKVLVCVWAYLCVWSFGKIISLHGEPVVFWGWKYFGYNVTAVVLFGVTAWVLNKFLLCKDKRLKVISLIGGFLLAIAIVYGAYSHYVNDIFRSTGETLQQFLWMFGILAFTMPLVMLLFEWLERAATWLDYKSVETSEKTNFWKKVVSFFRKYPKACFGAVWTSIFLCYMPVFLGEWPGNFVFDAKYQLANVISGYHFTHHPLIHTLMMGKAYELGLHVGDVSWGFQFYTLAQMLILSSAFAYLLLYLYKKHVRTGFLVAAWAFFALFPMNALFAISATKDVLCAAFFLYFLIFLVRYLFDKEKFKAISYIGMVASGALLALFRNNALYAIMATAVVLLIWVKGWKEKGKILLIFLAIYLVARIVNGGLMAYANASDQDSAREKMSVPLQCLARVASYRKDELSPELYDEICLYIPEQNIPKYSPYCADFIKNEANEKLLRENSVNFWKLWAKVGLQFPDEYVESIVTNTMGYWYPLNQGIFASADISLYHTLIGAGEEIVKKSYCDWASKWYSSLFWTNDYHYVPILGYLFRNAIYIWTVILYMLWSIYRKSREKILLGVLPLLYIGTCFLGPMAALRYIYCIVVSMPLLVYLVLVKDQKEIET